MYRYDHQIPVSDAQAAALATWISGIGVPCRRPHGAFDPAHTVTDQRSTTRAHHVCRQQDPTQWTQGESMMCDSSSHCLAANQLVTCLMIVLCVLCDSSWCTQSSTGIEPHRIDSSVSFSRPGSLHTMETMCHFLTERRVSALAFVYQHRR